MSGVSYPDWKSIVVYSAEGPKPQILAEEGPFKVVLAGLEPGAKIPPHPEGAAMYHFLEGSGWMVVDDRMFEIKPGATIITPAGATRGMEATTRVAFIAARMAS